MSEALQNAFFIVGCQRSGTTLMRLVLECHSHIECLDERFSYPMLAGHYEPSRRTRLLGLKVPCITEQFGQEVLSDILLLPESRNPYEGQPLLFMLRDVRDTVASMRALKLGNRPWLDMYLQPTLRTKREREPAFAERYASAFALLEQARHRELASAALYWRYKTESLLAHIARGLPVLAIRYEDLVARPTLELLRLCGFLRIPWEPALIAHPDFQHGEVDRFGTAIGGTDSRRPIDTTSVGKWRSSFSKDELDEILAFAGTMQSLAYPDSEKPLVGRRDGYA